MNKTNLNEHIYKALSLNVIEFKNVLHNADINMAYYEDDVFEFSPDSPICENLNKSFQFWFYQNDISKLRSKLEEKIADSGITNKMKQNDVLEDVIRLAYFITNLTGENKPFVSLRTVSNDYFNQNNDSVSQCFHRDSAVLTIFRTYYGKGTEYVLNANVIRSEFEICAIQPFNKPLSEFLYDPNQIKTTDSRFIGLLKGELNTATISDSSLDFITNFISKDEIKNYNIGNGLIHRGPLLDKHENRLVLTISVFRTYMMNR